MQEKLGEGLSVVIKAGADRLWRREGKGSGGQRRGGRGGRGGGCWEEEEGAGDHLLTAWCSVRTTEEVSEQPGRR